MRLFKMIVYWLLIAGAGILWWDTVYAQPRSLTVTVGEEATLGAMPLMACFHKKVAVDLGAWLEKIPYEQWFKGLQYIVVRYRQCGVGAISAFTPLEVLKNEDGTPMQFTDSDGDVWRIVRILPKERLNPFEDGSIYLYYLPKKLTVIETEQAIKAMLMEQRREDMRNSI